jgi:hypothetical protein
VKTTKEIAELFCDELDRIAKGEVRISVITGLDKCSNALVKLARLEMDYAWKDWDGNKPEVPWVASSLMRAKTVESVKGKELIARVHASPEGVTSRVADLEREIEAAEKEAANPKTTMTMKRILEWNDRIAFLTATKGKTE